MFLYISNEQSENEIKKKIPFIIVSKRIIYFGDFPGSPVVGCLPAKKTWVPPLIQEDPTGCRATKPSRYNKGSHYNEKPMHHNYQSVQFSHSVMSDSLRPHESQQARPPCPSQTPSLLKLMPIESVMPSSHLILCCPILLLSPIPPSIRVFSNESTLRMRWPKYWSFSFNFSASVLPMNTQD